MNTFRCLTRTRLKRATYINEQHIKIPDWYVKFFTTEFREPNGALMGSTPKSPRKMQCSSRQCQWSEESRPREVLDFTELNKFIVDSDCELPNRKDLVCLVGKYNYVATIDIVSCMEPFTLSNTICTIGFGFSWMTPWWYVVPLGTLAHHSTRLIHHFHLNSHMNQGQPQIVSITFDLTRVVPSH